MRLVFVCFLLISACALYRLRSRQYGARSTLWWGVFLAAVLAGAGADSWQAWLESFAGREAVRRPLGPVLYSVIFLLVLAWARSSFRKIPPRSLIDITTEDPEGRAHLILFLSDISDLQGFPSGVPAWLTGHDRNLDEDLTRLADEKREAKSRQQRARFWAWEQGLRAIRHHLKKETLKAVTVIASEESVQQVPMFAGLIAAYPVLRERQIDFKIFLRTDDPGSRLPRLNQDVPAGGGWCFEDFTELSQAVHTLLSLLRKDNFYDPDIMIDFTGGKKVTSVVAAAMTFNSSVKAQYVETEDPWKVLSYSVVTSDATGPSL